MPDIEVEVDDETIEHLKFKAQFEGIGFDDLVHRLMIEAAGVDLPGNADDGPAR